MTRIDRRGCAFLLHAAAALTASAQVSFHAIGVLPGGTYSVATDVSDDGYVVVGYADVANGSHLVRWSVDAGFTDLGTLAGYRSTFGVAISGDGFSIVGSAADPELEDAPSSRAIRWSAAEGIIALGGVAADQASIAADINSDGTVMVGGGYVSGGFHAVRWTSTGSFATLPEIGLGNSGAAAVSADGQIVAGDETFAIGPPVFTGPQSVRWSGSGSQQLGVLDADKRSYASAMTGDGTTVVGHYNTTSGREFAYRWSASTGLAPLPHPDDTNYHIPTGISDDGKKIVGHLSTNQGDTYAFLYTPEFGTVDLNRYLPMLGIDLTGWVLTEALGISADGLTIVGAGSHNGVSEGWVVNLGEDKDGDGLVDDWEVNGVPYTDSQGVSRRYLLDLNHDDVSDASPLRKDLFLEIDSMQIYQPERRALRAVIEAFDRAPVPAPPGVVGGLPGVALHIADSDLDLVIRDYDDTWNDFAADKEQWFGDYRERDEPEWPAMRQARLRAFRYCIFGRQYGTSTVDRASSGLAEGFGCDDFMVTIDPPDSDLAIKVDEEAGTLMHELGHALGLRHGGADDVNFKPNYFSTMNYLWQMPSDSYNDGGPNGSFRAHFPDYSDRALPDLDEDALVESAGIGGQFADVSVPFSIALGSTNCDIADVCDGSSTLCNRYADHFGPVDWNNNCSIDTTPVAADINSVDSTYATPLHEHFTGHNDWAALIYDFKGFLLSMPGAPVPEIIEEPDESVFEALNSLPPRPVCFTLNSNSPQLAGPRCTLSFSVAATGAGPFTYQWRALTPSGRVISDLSDGAFTDSHTGLSYTITGALADTITVSGISLASHPDTLGFDVLVTNSCGTVRATPMTITICRGDFNCDHAVDGDDVITFFAVWDAGEPTGDINNDGGTDGDDVIAFFTAWDAGC